MPLVAQGPPTSQLGLIQPRSDEFTVPRMEGVKRSLLNQTHRQNKSEESSHNVLIVA